MSEAAEELDEFTEDEVINLKEEPEETPKEPEAKDPENIPPGDEPTEEKEKVEFNEQQQEVFNDVVGKKVAAQREAERKADEAIRRAEQAEAKLREIEAPERPVVPPLPDPYDDDYEQKVAQRDAAIAAQVKWDDEQELQQRQSVQAREDAMRKQVEANNAIATAFVEKGDRSGFTETQLDTAVGRILDHGVMGPKARHLMTHESGPEMTMFLAKNPMEADKVGQMSEMEAAVYLETQILPKVRKSRKPVDVPPEVVDTPGAGAGIPDDDYGAKGWTIT